MAGKSLINGLRTDVEKLGLELLELESGQFGAGFLLLGVIEFFEKKNLGGGSSPVYIKEFFQTSLEVKTFVDCLVAGKIIG